MYGSVELSECSESCIGKSCNRSDDCGGPGEICDWSHRCALSRQHKIKQSPRNSNTNTKSSNSFPPWLIAVLTISLIVFFSAVGIAVAVFWYVKRMRLAKASHAETVFFQNTQSRGAEIPSQVSQQQNIRFPDSSNPVALTDQLQPGIYENVPPKTRKPIDEPQRFQNITVQDNLNSAQTDYDDERYQLENEQNNDSHHYDNIQHEPFYNTLEPTDTS